MKMPASAFINAAERALEAELQPPLAYFAVAKDGSAAIGQFTVKEVDDEHHEIIDDMFRGYLAGDDGMEMPVVFTIIGSDNSLIEIHVDESGAGEGREIVTSVVTKRGKPWATRGN